MGEGLRRTVVGGAVVALAVTTLTATPQVEAQQATDPTATVTTLEVDTPVIDGPGTVPLDDLPRSAFATGAGGTASTASTSLSDVPLGAIDLEASPLGAIGTSSVDLGTLPLGAIATGGVAAASAILDQVLLSSIPLHHDGGWEAILTGTPLADRPLQTITLGQVLGNTTAASALASTPLGAIDLSGTPLGAIPLGAIALGTLPLGAIKVSGDVAFCELFTLPEDVTSCNAVDSSQGTALELSLAGVDVGSTLGALPLGAIDWASTPLDATGVAVSPLGAIPLGAIDIVDSPLGAIPLGAIDWASTPLGAIQLSDIPLGAIQLDTSPLGAIPLGAIPLGAIAAESAPLGAIPLGAIPLGAIATKTSPLGAIPLGAIPLGAIATEASPLGAIPLGAIDVADSPLGAIPLGAIPLGAIATADSPLGAIPLGAIDVATSPLGAIRLEHVAWSTSPLGAIPVTDTNIQLTGLTLDTLGGLDQIPLRHVHTAADVFTLSVGAVNWSATALGQLGLDDLDPAAAEDLLACDGPDQDPCTAATIADAVNNGDIPSEATLGHVVHALAGTVDAGSLGDLLSTEPPAVPLATSAKGLLPLDDAGARSAAPFTLATLLGGVETSAFAENVQQLLAGMQVLRDADEEGTFGLTGTIGGLVGAATGTSLEGTLRDLLDDLLEGATFGDGSTVADLLDDLVADTTLSGALWELLAALDDSVTLQGELHDLLAGLVGDGDDDLGHRLSMKDTLSELFALVPDTYELKGDLKALLQHVDRDLHVVQGLLEGLLAEVEAELSGTLFGLLLGLLADEDSGVTLGLTLSDLLLSLMPTSDWNWEGIDLGDPELRKALAARSGAAAITMTVDVSATMDVDLSLQLPEGLSLEPGGTVVSPDGTAKLKAPVMNLNGRQATWHDLQLATGSHTVTVTVRPDTLAGEFRLRAFTEVDQVPQKEPVTASLVVRSPSEGDATPLVVPSGSLAIGHIGQSGDHDTYAIDVAAGQRLSLRLGNLPADLDLVLYREEPVVPLRQAPVESRLPIDEPPVTLTPSQVAVTADSQADVHVPEGARPHSISAHRADTDERIETGPLDAGRWLVRVSGYNGAFSSLPYTLRVRLVDGPDLGACPARFSPTQAVLAAGTSTQPALASATDTLFLVHRSRLAAMFGPEKAQDVVTAIQQLVTGEATDANGVEADILFLDGAPGSSPLGASADLTAIASAYQSWDAAPCDAESANDVVRAIGGLLDTAAQGRTLEHLVVVGSDEIVPFGRVADVTTLSNEQDHATAVEDHDAVAASLAAGRVLTDDVYADAVPIAVGERELFTPEVAIGRLVDTPEQILSSLAAYEASSGLLPVSGGFTSGYDFLTDGGERIGQELETLLGSDKVTRLLSETWTADDLSEHLVGAKAGEPADTTVSLAEIAAVNAHFDQHRLLPAFGDTTGDESDLLTTALLRNSVATGSNALAGRLLFSMGCHAGLSLPGVGDGNDDWADLFADTGALWVGNTGYGYGDTELVALSEDLMVRFADALDRTGTVGTALARAKAAYVRDLGIVSPYDEKALMQSTLYGLPFYRLDVPDGPPPQPPADVVPTPIDGTGLSRSTVSFDLTSELGQPTGKANEDGQWYSVDGETTSVPFRPIQPQTSREVTADPTTGLVATGALLTRLSSRDEPGFLPRYFRPTVDLSTTEPSQRMGDTAFPAALQSVSDAVAPDGVTRQDLVVIPGQFRAGGAGGSGTQRLFTEVEADVLYAPAATTDHLPPAINEVHSVVVGTGPYATGIAVRATDASNVHRVVVTYTAGESGQWSSFDLPHHGGDWYVGVKLVESDKLDYFVQVLDTAGNVAVSTNKGRFFGAVAVRPAEGPLVISGAVTLPGIDERVNGWFHATPVEVVFGPPPQGILPYYLVSVDGGPPTVKMQGQTLQITEEGVHRIRIEWIGDPNQFADLTLPIDRTPPKESTAAADPPANLAGWHRADVDVVLTAGEDPGPIGSGTDLLTWRSTGVTDLEGNTDQTSTRLTVTAEGRTTIHYNSADRASNEEIERDFTVKLDRTEPDVQGPKVATDASGAPQATPSPTGWYHAPPSITTSTTDPRLPDGPVDPWINSGIASLRVVGTEATSIEETAAGTEDGATLGTGSGLPDLAEGRTVLTAKSSDVAGNTFTTEATFHVDTTAPTSTLDVEAERNDAGWYNDGLDGDRTPTITAVDNHPDQDPDQDPDPDTGLFPSGIGSVGVAAVADPSVGGLDLARQNRTAADSDTDGWTDNAVALDPDTWEVGTRQPISQEGITELRWGARDRAILAEDGAHAPGDSFPLTHAETLRLDVTPPTITVNAVPFPAAARPELEDRVDTVLTSPSRDADTQVFTPVPLPDSVVDPATPPTYHLRQAVPVQFACADGVSTVLSCTSQFIDPAGVARTGPVVGNAATLETSAPGLWEFRVTATDVAGNEHVFSYPYRSAFRLVDDARTCQLYRAGKAVNAGANLALRMAVCDVGGVAPENPSVRLRAITVDGTSTPVDSGDANADGWFRWDERAGHHVFNLDTTGLAPGPHTVEVRIDADPATPPGGPPALLYELHVAVRE